MILVCFDTETTGLDVQKEHIIQLSLVKVETADWSVVDQRDWYILPEGDFTIPAEAEAVHHISKPFLLEHGVGLRSVYDDFAAFTEGCDMLSYNGNGYDAPLLHYNLKRLGLDFRFEGRMWYDALLLERIHTAGMTDEKGEKLHCNLTAAYTRYYGHPFEDAHNSLGDVRATIEVFKAQIAAHGWEWAQREEFGFICFDRWLTKRGNYYYLTQGGHKGESIESMMRIDRSYLEWIVDKCQWTDDQTRQIILKVLSPKPSAVSWQQSAAVTWQKTHKRDHHGCRFEPFLRKSIANCTFFAQIFAYVKKKYYLCTRFANLAGWMSDLVSGLQNRTERFDSATGLQAASMMAAYFIWMS